MYPPPGPPPAPPPMPADASAAYFPAPVPSPEQMYAAQAPVPSPEQMYGAQETLQSLQQPYGRPPPRPLVIIPLCRKGDRAGIEKQIQAGATVDEVDVEGNTPLHVAVEAPKNEIATVQCLLENGADPNALNYLGAAPLHYVCLRKSNYRGVANLLIENGADINCLTLAGKTALHFACENQLPELVEILCQFAADTNVVDIEGNSPVHLTLVKEGGRDTVKRQILDELIIYQAQFHTPNIQGWTPLHLACRGGHIRCLHCLLERGADMNAITCRREHGLHLACLGGFAEVVQLLLQVSPTSVDAIDIEGNTPLHACALVGTLDCATLLLKGDANVNIKNNQKKSAFDLAKLKGTDLNSTHDPELLQVLKDAKKGGGCRQS